MHIVYRLFISFNENIWKIIFRLGNSLVSRAFSASKKSLKNGEKKNPSFIHKASRNIKRGFVIAWYISSTYLALQFFSSMILPRSIVFTLLFSVKYHFESLGDLENYVRLHYSSTNGWPKGWRSRTDWLCIHRAYQCGWKHVSSDGGDSIGERPRRALLMRLQALAVAQGGVTVTRLRV